MLSKGILGGLVTHITISIGSLAYATKTSSFNDSSSLPLSQVNEVVIARRVIDSMYDHCFVGPINLIDDNLVFEDPAALCANRKEVENAFFLLKFISPLKVVRNVHSIIDNGKMRNRKTVVLEQQQQYTICRELILRSYVLVDVDVEKQKVVRIEERWNGNKLLLIGYPSRVINGIVSNLFTEMLLAIMPLSKKK